MPRMVPRVRRLRRHGHIRRRLSGSPKAPRLSVFRSSQHIYVQLIDDTTGSTIVAASTLDNVIKQEHDGKSKTDKAKVVGQIIAERAKGAGIDRVVFDRGGNLYHGRVKAVAEGARAGGLQF